MNSQNRQEHSHHREHVFLSRSAGHRPYRGTFNFGTVTKISKWLGWQNQLGDIYVTNPPVSAKKNDVVFTTGLNIAFTHSTAP